MAIHTYGLTYFYWVRNIMTLSSKLKFSGFFVYRFVVGLVSHGRDSSCGSEAMPSLYTDLTYFKSWVMTQVKLLESAPKEKCDEKLREKQRLKKRKDQLKQQQMRNKTKKKVKKENLSKLMNLIPITKNTNVQHSIFFEAWPIYSPPFR